MSDNHIVNEIVTHNLGYFGLGEDSEGRPVYGPRNSGKLTDAEKEIVRLALEDIEREQPEKWNEIMEMFH